MALELDPKWLATYLEKEINRLKKLEKEAKVRQEEAAGNVAKYDHLISMETARDAEYQRAKRIEEKKLEHHNTVLDHITPTLNKLSEQWAILTNLDD